MGLRERMEDSLSEPESGDLRGPRGHSHSRPREVNIKGPRGNGHRRQKKHNAKSERREPRGHDLGARGEDERDVYVTAPDGGSSLESSNPHHG